MTSSTSSPDKCNLCVEALIHKRCSRSGCPDLHTNVPFQWQIFTDGQWEDLEPNEAIERDFSKPHIHSYRLADPKRDSLIGYLDFNTMTCYGPQTRPVRRLNAPSVDRWVWYYRDRHDEWIQFGEKNSWGKNSKPGSAIIEGNYDVNPEVVMTYNGCQLNFKEMCQSIQKNVRPIRRRPQFQTRVDGAHATVYSALLGDKSDLFQISYENDYTTSELQTGYSDYSSVVKMFHGKMDKTRFKITGIMRVDNPLLWHVYQRKKEQMVRDNGKEKVNEQRLFHVTRTSVQHSICTKNFDFRYAGSKLRNGRGSYFCSDPQYAHNHFEDHRNPEGDEICMFLARVLVGVSCPQQSVRQDSLLPPSRDGSVENLYDSVVNDLGQPFNYAIYYPSQIYPEYIIKYTSR